MRVILRNRHSLSISLWTFDGSKRGQQSEKVITTATFANVCPSSFALWSLHTDLAVAQKSQVVMDGRVTRPVRLRTLRRVLNLTCGSVFQRQEMRKEEKVCWTDYKKTTGRHGQIAVTHKTGSVSNTGSHLANRQPEEIRGRCEEQSPAGPKDSTGSFFTTPPKHETKVYH